MFKKSFLSPSGITPAGRPISSSGEDVKANLSPDIVKRIVAKREQAKMNEKMDWENKQNNIKKRTMYVPTAIPGQVRAVEID